MLYGYGGKILRVNLSTGQITKEELKKEFAEKFIGGRGFAAKILYDEVPKGADPLGPDNKVVIASGPVAGTFVPGAGKITIASKSPQTLGYGDSNMGGHLASEIKYAGYDAIIIEGVSEKPCYLYINNDEVEIRDASKYWGKGCLTAEEMMKNDLGEEFQICVIGPAGEKLVKYACVSHDFGRQAGRTGTGAVLGTKKLKGIAIKGTKSIPLADSEKVLEFGKKVFAECKAAPALKEWQDYGTIAVVPWASEIGAMPTRNFQYGTYENSANLNGPTMREAIVVTDKACFCCPMACGKYCHTKKENKYDVHVEGPEYETMALIGSNCAMIDVKDVAYANYLCDELGIDTISAGNCLAFAMECYEKGYIDKEITDGLDLSFGNADTVFELLKKIGNREEGIGATLAEGVTFASKKWGHGSEKFAMAVKGLEWSGYESRGAPAMLLSYLTCDVGAHHNRSWAITHDLAVGREKIEGKETKVIELQKTRPMFDLLGICRLQWVELNINLATYPTMYEAITGTKYNLDDLLKASDRVYNLTRLFWTREVEGFGRKFDYPPARVTEEPVTKGATEGKFVPQATVDLLLDNYYIERGWDKQGLPTLEKLKELGLEEEAKQVCLTALT